MSVSKVVDTGDGWRGVPGDTQGKQENEWSLVVYPSPSYWYWTAQVPHDDWYKSTSGWCYTEDAAKKAAIAVAKGLT